MCHIYAYEISHYLRTISEARKLLSELNHAAAKLNMSASTISRLAGQGGGLPACLEAGKRIWPETADKVRDVIADLMQARGAAWAS